MLIASQRIGEKRSDDRTDVLTAPSRLMDDEEISLVCWRCGRTEKVDVSGLRNGIFRLSDVVKRVKWVSGFDFKRRRVLAFCSDRCKENARGDGGYFKSISRSCHRRKSYGVPW